MPFYVADYLGDTEHLSTLQHGAYCLLLFSYWRRGGLPDDDQQLANIAKMPLEDWLAHKATLQALFYDGWRHKRVDAELCRAVDKIAKRKAAGSKGGQVTAMANEIARYKSQRVR